MGSYCNANCEECTFKESCRGCTQTCGMPFGGRCVAAEYIRAGGKEAYNFFKNMLKDEINELLKTLGIPAAEELFELPGHFVNLAYALPSGESVLNLHPCAIVRVAVLRNGGGPLRRRLA